MNYKMKNRINKVKKNLEIAKLFLIFKILLHKNFN